MHNFPVSIVIPAYNSEKTIHHAVDQHIWVYGFERYYLYKPNPLNSSEDSVLTIDH